MTTSNDSSVQSDANGLFYFINGDTWTAYNTMTEACEAKKAYDETGCISNYSNYSN